MVNFIIYILVVIFGSSSWLSTNSVWMELSLIVEELPEGWNLPSYLSAIIQISCIGPLLYSIIHKCTNFNFPTAPIIQGLLILCTICTIALAFLWNKTAIIFGYERSISLIIIMFFMALVNSTSDVLFMPYMSTFQPTYLTAYFVGMGLSALIPSIVSLIQGTGNYECFYNATSNSTEPNYFTSRFGVRDYNLIMFAWMLITAFSFAFLHWGRHLIKSEKFKSYLVETDLKFKADEISPSNIQSLEEIQNNDNSSFIRYCTFLGCLSIICAQMNGIVPNIQSYSALSYNQLTYHLALSFGDAAQAFACFIPIWIQPRKTSTLITLTIIATGFCAYIVSLAAQSPTPLLLNSFWGKFFSVFASTMVAALHAYLRTVFTCVLRQDNPNSESRLFWCGAFMQIGSFIGTFIMFPLVNIFNLFESAPPCR